MENAAFTTRSTRRNHKAPVEDEDENEIPIAVGENIPTGDTRTIGELIDYHQRLTLIRLDGDSPDLYSECAALELIIRDRLRGAYVPDRGKSAPQLYEVNQSIREICLNCDEPMIRRLVELLARRVTLINKINNTYSNRTVVIV